MKKTGLLFVGLLALAGCSSEKLVDCRMERQELRIQIDKLNETNDNLNLQVTRDKQQYELLIAGLESKLKSAQLELEEVTRKLDTEFPELQSAYDSVSEQLNTANNAIRKELADKLNLKESIKQFQQQLSEIEEKLKQKDELLKQANEKLEQMTKALAEKAVSEQKEQTEESK